MLILSYGYKKPGTNDKGLVFFPALEFNIQRLNDHTHNGTNSAKIPATSVLIQTLDFTSGAWASVGDGTYRQVITLPGSAIYEDFGYMFRLSTGEFFYPKIEKFTSNSFYLYINDNTRSGKVILLT